MLHLLAKIIVSPLVFVMSLAGYPLAPTNTPVETKTEATLGSYNPAGGTTYRLQTSVGTTNNTIPLSSFKNRSGIPLTMALLDTDIGYGTLSPQTSRSEFISFTGITQNANGSATLTGVSRGLSDISPFTASTTLRQAHPGQSVFILSDSPQLFNEYVTKRNAETISGVKTFTSATPPKYDNNPDFTSSASTTIVSKGYVDDASITGSVPATISVPGIGVLQRTSYVGNGVQYYNYGGTNYPLLLTDDLATTTMQVASRKIVVTGDDGAINPNFLNKSGVNYTFNGSTTFAATTTFTGYLNSATTTSRAFIGKNFGGTGSDGPLACTSGTTSIDLGNATIVVKNYTSISITGTCSIAFTNPATAGSMVILLSQGDVTITSSTNPAIDLRSLGSSAGTGSKPDNPGTGGGGGGGASMIANGNVSAAPGSNLGTSVAGSAGTTFGVWQHSSTSLTGGGLSPCNGTNATAGVSPLISTTNSIAAFLRFYILPGTGGGGGCGNNSSTFGGSGGRGGGALYMEVGGSLNISSVINAAGTASANTSNADIGCGGGGGGGSIQIMYNYLISNTGTYTVAGGASGGTCSSAGGAGAAGYSSVTQNIIF